MFQIIRYDSSLRDACTGLGKKWSEVKDDDAESISSEDFQKFSSHQKIQFLAELLDKVRQLKYIREEKKYTTAFIPL